MLQTFETQTIPLEITHADHVTFVHAHPDDEVSNGGLIDKLVAGGITISAIVATVGEASDRGDPAELRQGSRLLEARNSYNAYSIPETRQHFWRFPDGLVGRPPHFRHLVQRFSTTFRQLGTTVLITPGEFGFDGHGDHRAVHHGGLAAVRNLREFGLPIRVWGLDESGSEHVAVQRDQKLARLALHVSQFTIRQRAAGASPFELSAETARLLAPYDKLLTSHETYREY